MPSYSSTSRTVVQVLQGIDSVAILNVPCNSNCSVGDFVYLDSSFVAQRTSSSATSTCLGVIGCIDQKPTSTTCNVITHGLTSSIFSGLSAGSQYRLASTAGAITSSSQTNDILVGRAYSATSLVVRIGPVQDTGGGGGGGSGITRSVNLANTSISAGSDALLDYVYLVSGSSVTVTMPTAVGNLDRYSIKNVNNSGDVTIAFAGSETCDGSASLTLRPLTSLDLISDGTNWFII